jgi:FkbM family methyltransferase
MSYSQQGEDLIIFELLKRKDFSDSQLLEIGAWHPTQLSNSRLLIEQGWRAVLIEPTPYAMMAQLEQYGGNSRVQLVQAAVSCEASHLERMHVTRDAVSTSVDAVHEAWLKQGGYLGSLWVPTISIPELLNQFGGFAYVSIDAEGLSVPLAREYVASGARPYVMCCEHDGRIPELMSYAQPFYTAAHINDTNVILVLA